MKFLTQIITLSKSQYVITNRPTIWQVLFRSLSVWLKILIIIVVSLHSGYEHTQRVIARQIARQLETLSVNVMSSLLSPKGAYA